MIVNHEETTNSSSLVAVLQRPVTAVMGILNATPDSFSDGGKYLGVASAVEHGLKMINQGADILDVGGESTRPGADVVSLQEELDRVLPIIERLSAESDVPISVDTHKADVMREAVRCGASMINDVNALRSDGALQAASEAQVPICLMHMQGEPKSMQTAPEYRDVVTEVEGFLQERINECLAAGVASNKLIVDPGIGFGKSLSHNLSLLKAVPRLINNLQCQVLIGVSRKSMIDHILSREVEERGAGSIGLAVQASINGAKIVRVHDVQETVDAIRCVEAVSGI